MEKGTTFKVLDHGYVKYIDSMGTDETIVEAARMSTGRGFVSWEPYYRCKTCDATWKLNPADPEKYPTPHPFSQDTVSVIGTKTCDKCEHNPLTSSEFTPFPMGDLGILDNLWRHKHATPFEMCELLIEVQAPIMVFREWMRHRTQSFNEFSARYSQMPDLHYVPELERFTPKKSGNRQESSITSYDHMEVSFDEIRDVFVEEQREVYDNYEESLKAGVPKEVARLNTPVSRYSKMRAKANLRNWLGFLNLRMRPAAQLEIRQYANVVGEIIKSIWPRVWSLFEEYDLYGTTLSRSELDAVRLMLYGNRNRFEAARESGLADSKTKEFFQKLDKAGLEIL
jgi:thymidylate synthase (FAD)